MLLKTTLLALVASLCFSKGYTQSHENKFSQFIMTNIDTREQTITIDQFMRNQSGIVISRADLNSKKYLCIYTSESNISRQEIDEWMQQLGVEYKCYREGIHQQDPILDQKTNCDQ